MALKNYFLITVIALFTWGNGVAQDDAGRQITVEDIWKNYRFFPSFPSEFNWMNDDNFYSVLKNGKIEKYSVEKQERVETILDVSELKDPDTGEKIDVKTYSFAKDERQILLKTGIEPIYRRSSREITYVWDQDREKLHKLQAGEKVSFATISPDGNQVAYMYANNLYIYNMEAMKARPVTSDGMVNQIINGGTDWVYEEEFAFTRAFFWSSDSEKLAYYRFDERHVREFSMTMYGDLYPEEYRFKYPKAGEENAFVDLFIFDIVSGKNIPVDLGPEKDQYIPRIKWTKDRNKLAVMRMNRLQNQNEVLMVDGTTGKSEVILTEQEDTYVEQPSDNTWIFLDNGEEFLWQSERSGYNHVYRYDFSGKMLQQVTSGKFDVTEITAVDEAAEFIYYMSTEVSSLERHLYRIRMDGKKKTRMTEEDGWHSVTFSKNNTFYMDSYSTITTPTRAALYNQKGKEVMVLEENKRLAKTMAAYALSEPEFMQIPTEGGEKLNAYIIRPADFDESKAYPVMMHVYGGPGSQTVKNQYLGFNYFWHQMLAQKGYIVVSVDNRGTGGRGEDFKKVTYGELGKYETLDQIAAAKWLGQQSWVDADRIGIWGWSFGGYMTSLCLTKGGGTFSLGIAVAPVTNWRFYDTIYTERYLKTPKLNPSGYDDNSPIQFAEDLQGDYLLVHGTADDNVHYQNSIEWSDALIGNAIPFDMAFYPNKNHGIFGGLTRLHLYRKMTDFVLDNL
ncbi:MAG: S9 family peptidase [Bacteroidota bacterium]